MKGGEKKDIYFVLQSIIYKITRGTHFNISILPANPTNPTNSTTNTQTNNQSVRKYNQ